MFRSAIVASALCLGLVTANVEATEKMYAVVSAGYADSEFAQYSDGSAAYKLAIGHQIHPQWYVEGGYQKIATDDSDSATALDSLDGDALFLSVLGKASSRDGELYYRLGIMRADLVGNQTVDDTIQPYDNGVLAGVVGVGFDWYVGLNTMVRFEVEHISGEDSFQSNAAYIGFRYNFR